VDLAFNCVAARPELTVLLGIAAAGPETEYGWIEPAAVVGDNPLFTVRRFWEKPRPRAARELFRRGCLCDSFVMVGHISTLLNLFLIALPQLCLSFRKICPMFGTTSGQKAQNAEIAQNAIDQLYARLSPADFSEEYPRPLPGESGGATGSRCRLERPGRAPPRDGPIARTGFQPKWAAA
jgi:hypothetical protein